MEMNDLADLLFPTSQAQSKPHSNCVKYFSPGCTKEPGYFASGDSIQGYAGISMKYPDDCAIKCAGVLGCVGWTFNHQKENR